MKQDRATVLLKAAFEVLERCQYDPRLEGVLDEIVFYDEVDCDAFCLLKDIESFLEDEENPRDSSWDGKADRQGGGFDDIEILTRVQEGW